MRTREREIRTEMERVLHELDGDFCAFGLLVGESRALEWKLAIGHLTERYKQIVNQPGKGLNGAVVKVGRGMSLHVTDLIMKRELHEYPLMMAEKLRSAYAVPLMDGRQVAGILLVGHRFRRIYRPEDRARAEAAGQTIAALLDNARQDRLFETPG